MQHTAPQLARMYLSGQHPSPGAIDEWLRVLCELVVKRIWLPIDSAPRDGSAVLVMKNDWPGCKDGVAADCNGHNTYVAAWWDGEGIAGDWICYMGHVRDPQCPVEPTHWMPLPEPPRSEQ